VTEPAATGTTGLDVPQTLASLLGRAEPGDVELTEGRDAVVVNQDGAPLSFERASCWAEALGSLLAPAQALGLVRVGKRVRCDSGLWDVTIEAGPRCGFCVAGTRDDPVFVSVRPKIEDVDFLGLAGLAGWLPGAMRLEETSQLAARTAPSLLALFLRMYDGALSRLFSPGGGLRRLHERVDETLVARCRGQLRLPAWQREVTNGRLLHFPCRFSAHELDNVPNRALLWALDVLLRLAQTAHDEDARRVALALRGHEACFGGVSLAPVRSAELDRVTRLPQAFAHYDRSGALPLARWILRHFHPSDRPGDAAGLGFGVDMAELFEAAFARVVERGFAGCEVEAQARWWFRIAQSEGSGGTPKTFQPDVFVPGDAAAGLRPLVLDTKWKDAVPVAGSPLEDEREGLAIDTGGLRVKNVDLFQVAAYAYLGACRA